MQRPSSAAVGSGDGGEVKMTARDPLQPITDKGRRAMNMQRRGTTADRVQVAVRVRPLNQFDRGTDGIITVEDTSVSVVARGGSFDGREKRFNFDHVFTEDQETVYDCIGKPMLHDAFEGYNVCLFAYGQTGSGKTFSILGESNPKENEGIIPRFCRDMLSAAQERLENDPTLTIKISMSYIEIYNEKVRDLLEQKKRGQSELSSLEIRETPDRRIYVEGLWRPTVTSFERIRRFIDFGNAQKQVSETKMNEKSSRSHSILQFYVSQTYDPPSAEKRDMESVLTLVDLAGSERQSKTESEGKAFEESKNINRSLLMLSRALNSFSDGKAQHVPLRESKLTRLLSESFGGNSRTWMLACVSPSAFNYSETMSTLEYAQNAKAIINRAKVNSIQQRLELRELQKQHLRLRELYDLELEKNKQYEARLQQQAQEFISIKAENERLRRRCGEAEVEVDGLRTDLETARSKVNYLESRPSEPGTVMRHEGGASRYIGRAKVSLRNIIEQMSNYLTLPLVSDSTEPDADGGMLVVNIYPVDSKGASKLDPPTKTAPGDLLGHRVDFVVHIIKATGIPQKYSHVVFCKYVYKWAEKESYKTGEVMNNTNPEFDFKKRFAFSKMNPGLVDYFMSDNVITFEVIGQAEPSAKGAGAA